MSSNVRRLAAIMFTDIVGYTALTQADETQTLEVLDRHNRLLRPFFPKFHGREVKAIGDSFLVEFDSALDAINCAVEIQQYLHDYNISTRDEWKITLRIGIHLGDVVDKAGDVFGDAVNIASRIQPLADPEGICVSDQVFGQVRNKVQQVLVKLGPQDLKNVRFPVEVYKVVMPWSAEPPAQPVKFEKTRIAVLPFANFSQDPNDAYFADGITEEIISTVSGVSGLSVISRTSIMGYKGTSKMVKDIGKELQVGSVLEGSFRKAGNRIRITTQLIDVSGDEHLWAQNYDRELDDVFEVQSDIARQVAEALRVRILPHDQRQIEKTPTKNVEAHALYLKGRYFWNQRNKESMTKAIEDYKEAIRLDPNFALPYSGISDCYAVLGNYSYMPFAEAFSNSKEFALKAVKLDPTSGEAHTSLASALGSLRDPSAENEFRRAIELNPSYATAHHWYAIILTHHGRLNQALEEAKKAQQLDPLSPQITVFLGNAYAALGQYDASERQYVRALELSPDHLAAIGNLVSLRWHQKRFSDADTSIAKYRELSGDDIGCDAALAATYALAGRKDAREVLARAEAHPNPEHYYESMRIIAYIALGELETAIRRIQDECDRGADWLGDITYDSLYAPVKDDPRVQDVLRKVGAIP